MGKIRVIWASATSQSFGDQAKALAVPIQHLHELAALAAKYEQVPAKRIMSQCLLHLPGQAVEATAAPDVPPDWERDALP